MQAAFKAALQRKWPFIADYAFQAPGSDRRRDKAELEAVLRANPTHPFALIHMDQVEAERAKWMLENHANVFFITSHSNPVSTSRSRQPWVNMFDGQILKAEWRVLIICFPRRFILAFDNVFAGHWGAFYLAQAAVWRHALEQLPADVAHLVAHGNAERLWNLPPTSSGGK